MLNINITAKNLELTGQLREFITEKISKLEKFIEKFKKEEMVVFDMLVEVKKETMHHRKGDVFTTEVKLYLPRKNLFAKAHGEDLYHTIIETKKELKKALMKYKVEDIELPRRRYSKVKKDVM